MSSQVWSGFRQKRGTTERDAKPAGPTGKKQAGSTHKPKADVPAALSERELQEADTQLLQFDLTSKYGPCRDLTRIERCVRERAPYSPFKMTYDAREWKISMYFNERMSMHIK